MTDIVQWNCRGYGANFEELKSLLKFKDGPACVCLQETFHGMSTPYAPSRYTAVTATPVVQIIPGIRPSRGLITLIKSNIPFYKLNINTSLENLTIRVNIGREITICNIYISPTEQITINQLTNLVNQLPSPFLILGDINARNNLWGDVITNSRGSLIENFLLQADICLLNDGSPTHFHIQNNTESCIDLSITSPELINEFTWTVSDENYGTDHFPISLKRLTNAPPEDPISSYNFDKADWTLFRRLTIVPDNLFQDLDNSNEMVDLFNSTIINAANQAIPKKSSSTKYPVPWWSADCNSYQREKKATRRRYRRTGSIADKIALNRASALARRSYRRNRKECWQKYVSTINSETPINKIFKKLQESTESIEPFHLKMVVG